MVLKHCRLGNLPARVLPGLAAAVLLLAHPAPPAAAQNLLVNPNFDVDLSGWSSNSSSSWDGTLNDTAGGGGSAKGVFDAASVTGLSSFVTQCVPLVVGKTYRMGGEIYIPPGATATASAFYGLIPFPTPDCSGPPPPAGPFPQTPPVSAVGLWLGSFTTFENGFAQSGLFGAYLAPTTGGHFQANFDNTDIDVNAQLCHPDTQTLCFEAGRFQVTAVFQQDGGSPTAAQAVPILSSGSTSGYFWFFDAANVEVVVKMIDGCAVNGHHWFFAGGLTNVQTTIIVQDLTTGALQTYVNPPGSPFQPIQDTAAFSCP